MCFSTSSSKVVLTNNLNNNIPNFRSLCETSDNINMVNRKWKIIRDIVS